MKSIEKKIGVYTRGGGRQQGLLAKKPTGVAQKSYLQAPLAPIVHPTEKYFLRKNSPVFCLN